MLFPHPQLHHVKLRTRKGQKLGLALHKAEWGAPGGTPEQDLGQTSPMMSFIGFISHDQLLFCPQGTHLPLSAALSRATIPAKPLVPLFVGAGALWDEPTAWMLLQVQT